MEIQANHLVDRMSSFTNRHAPGSGRVKVKKCSSLSEKMVVEWLQTDNLLETHLPPGGILGGVLGEYS
jgi:hypothetical protein